MAKVVQDRAVALQLAGELRGGDALSDTAKDQDQLSDRPLRSLKGGAGEEVEDPFAVIAAVVDDRSAMATVDSKLIWALTAGTNQALGMEPVEQGRVASVGVQQFFNGKVHDDLAGLGETLARLMIFKDDSTQADCKYPGTEWPT